MVAIRVLEGEERVPYGWGLLPMGVGIALWAFSYAPPATKTLPFPPEPHWRVPVMWAGAVLAMVGLFLLVAPLVRRARSRRRAVEIAPPLVPPVDLTITNDMGQLFVCNNGARAEFIADVVGMTGQNGRHMNKQWSVIWAGQDENAEPNERVMDIPTGVTRTLLVWKGRFINGPLMTPAVEFLPHPNSDYIIPTLDGQTVSVRLRIVRLDPPGFTERTVRAGRSTDGKWIAEVSD